MCYQLLYNDYIMFLKFVHKKRLTRKKADKYPLSAVNPIDPFIELGQIPSQRNQK
jgi:hypothetical protein